MNRQKRTKCKICSKKISPNKSRIIPPNTMLCFDCFNVFQRKLKNRNIIESNPFKTYKKAIKAVEMERKESK